MLDRLRHGPTGRTAIATEVVMGTVGLTERDQVRQSRMEPTMQGRF